MVEKEDSQNQISYWKDKKLWTKAILFSSISLFAVVPIYVLLRNLEKLKIKKEKEKEK